MYWAGVGALLTVPRRRLIYPFLLPAQNPSFPNGPLLVTWPPVQNLLPSSGQDH